MPNFRISQLQYVGNTGYTSTDIFPFVNYIEPSGTTSHTTLLQHKEWVLSGLSSSYLPLTGGTVDYIDFTLTANPAYKEGRVHWDSTMKTLEIDTDVNGVSIEVGHMNIVRVVNKTGSDLLKGQLVYINGAQGQRPTVTLASYEGDPTSARTLGFVMADINNNNNGYVISYGVLRDVNTSAFSAGTQLYLFTGGTWTNVRPIAPNHEVRIGVVVDQNATTGIIFVNVMNGYELSELHDVSATTVNNLDVLQWNSSQNVWQPTNNPIFNSISATTISGGTLYGDGSNLTNVDNIYTIDGSLTGNRNLNLNSNSLTISATTPSRFFANGNVAIGTTNDVGNKLYVFSTSDPVRFDGLQVLDTDTQVVTTDTNGVLHKRTYDYVTGFTYTSSANTFTIRTSSGNTYNALINRMSGLTIDGDLTVLGDYVVSGDTIISGNTIFSGTTTLQTVPNAIGNFLTLPSGGTVSQRTSDQVRDDIGYYGLTFAIMNGYY